MTRQKNLLLLLLLALFVGACSDTASSEAEGQGDDMGQFADDENFKDKHEQPAQINFDPAGEMVTFSTPDGKEGSAYYLPASEESTKYLFVIHEWWGLNDITKMEADKYATALENVHVMALDLYDGKSTSNPDEAGKLMQSVQEDRVKAIINGAIAKAGEEAKIATIGWCFGGGWSLRSAILAGDQGIGCVMYYGMPVQKADQLQPLETDILGIFASKDEWINEKVINDFEALCAATGTKIETHWFDADHAFANPSNPSYNEEAAQKANQLALDYLKGKF